MTWGDPIFVDDLDAPTRAAPLTRVTSSRLNGQPGYREALLQHLVHTAPECLPVRSIDPAFFGLRAVCKELPLREDVGRYADNLLINPDGRLCLVECKLANNAEADRDVTAQLIDYAAALTRLDYAGLQERARQAMGRTTGDPLLETVLGDGADPDSGEDFIVGVERSLRTGEILLLIVGDRIRPNTQRLVELLQDRVNLGFTFGLIEMPVYATITGGYIVHPRVLMKTEIVRRTVFLAAGAGPEVLVQRVEGKEPAASLGEADFYASLAKVDPSFPAAVRSLLKRLTDIGCEVLLLRKFNVYLDDGLGGRVNVLSISAQGAVYAWAAASRDAQLGLPIGREYLARIANLLPDGALYGDDEHPGAWSVRIDGRPTLDLRMLLAHQDAWIASITRLRDQIVELQRKREII